MIEKLKQKKGITLIALVITIIVLLILAGVSIAMLTGDNGILTQATNAKEKTDKATEEEKIQMAVLGSSVDNNGYVDILDETSFKQELANQFGSQSLDVVANGDGSFIITVENTQRKYYVNDDKTVINSDNIIEISTTGELASFRDDVNAGNTYEGKAVLLTDDITLSGEWEPIGFISKDADIKNPDTETNKPFKGIFDGCNQTIDNLVITSTENRYNALFEFAIDASIRNVTIGKDSEITGSSGAGVVGYLYGFQGNISNCINYANTNGAGIVYTIEGQHTIYNCKNYGTITGYGGIVGSSNGTDWEQFTSMSNKIINCGNYGSIKKESGSYCGGIVGYFKGDILNCCNKGNVGSIEVNVGGIVGTVDGSVQNCYNIGNVTTEKWNVGGIVGLTGDSFGTQIINTYSKGDIVSITYPNSIGDILGVSNPENGGKDKITNSFGKNDTFTASNLGDAFKEDTENKNNGYPILYWE